MSVHSPTNALEFNPDSLRTFALFSRLASDERSLLAKCMQRRGFRAGETLTRQGEPCTRLFCILAGRVTVSVRYPGAEKSEDVAVLGENTTVGDFGLTEIPECTATTTAASETFVLEGDIKSLLALFDRQPELGKKVYRALSKHLVARVQEMNKNLFYLL
jgi:CRP-like cAMP-binding protein